MASTDERTRSEMERALRQAAEPMPAAARADVRRTVMAAVDSSSRRAGWSLTVRRAAVAVAACVAVTGGVAYAASDSLPGEPLYPVKRGGEQFLLGVLPEGALERSLLLHMAERRAEEAAALAAEGAESATYHHAIDDLREAVRHATPEGGALPDDEIERIRHQAQGAPESAREEIAHAITDAGGTGTKQEDPHSGTGSGGTGSGDTGGGSGGDTSGGTGGGTSGGTGDGTHDGGTGTGGGGHDTGGGGDSGDHTGEMGSQP